VDVTFDVVEQYLQDSHKKLSIVFNDLEKSALFDKRWTVKRVAAQSIQILSASTEGKYTLTDGKTVFSLKMTVGELTVDRVKIVEVGETDPRALELPPAPATKVMSSRSSNMVAGRPSATEDTKPEPVDMTMIEGASLMEEVEATPTLNLELINVDTQESYRLDTFPAILGRKEFNPNPERVAVDLKLQRVSREHARIFQSSSGKLFIETLSSSKPVSVSGVVISSGDEPIALADGDMLLLGDVNLRVLLDA
jgi:hypothetical protein